MADSSSIDHWLERLEALRNGLVTDAEREIATSPEIQAWLQERVQIATSEMVVAEDVEALITIQSAIQDDLHEQFPALAEAVDVSTGATAGLLVEWHPDSPDRSSIHIRFRTSIRIDAYRQLASLETSVLSDMLAELVDTMPSTQPYSGHPHTLGVMAIHEGTSLPFQIIDQFHDDHRTRWLRLLPSEVEVRGNIEVADGAEALAEYFRIARPS